MSDKSERKFDAPIPLRHIYTNPQISLEFPFYTPHGVYEFAHQMQDVIDGLRAELAAEVERYDELARAILALLKSDKPKI